MRIVIPAISNVPKQCKCWYILNSMLFNHVMECTDQLPSSKETETIPQLCQWATANLRGPASLSDRHNVPRLLISPWQTHTPRNGHLPIAKPFYFPWILLSAEQILLKMIIIERVGKMKIQTCSWKIKIQTLKLIWYMWKLRIDAITQDAKNILFFEVLLGYWKKRNVHEFSGNQFR